jgi:hypothetical protein
VRASSPPTGSASCHARGSRGRWRRGPADQANQGVGRLPRPPRRPCVPRGETTKTHRSTSCGGLAWWSAPTKAPSTSVSTVAAPTPASAGSTPLRRVRDRCPAAPVAMGTDGPAVDRERHGHASPVCHAHVGAPVRTTPFRAALVGTSSRAPDAAGSTPSCGGAHDEHRTGRTGRHRRHGRGDRGAIARRGGNHPAPVLAQSASAWSLNVLAGVGTSRHARVDRGLDRRMPQQRWRRRPRLLRRGRRGAGPQRQRPAPPGTVPSPPASAYPP